VEATDKVVVTEVGVVISAVGELEAPAFEVVGLGFETGVVVVPDRGVVVCSVGDEVVGVLLVVGVVGGVEEGVVEGVVGVGVVEVSVVI